MHGIQLVLVQGEEYKSSLPLDEVRNGQIIEFDTDFILKNFPMPDSNSPEEFVVEVIQDYGKYGVYREEELRDGINKFISIPSFGASTGELPDTIKIPKIYGTSAENNETLTSFIGKYARKINFYPEEFLKCKHCSHWDTEDSLFYLEPSGYICKYCCSTTQYLCDSCDCSFTISENTPRQLYAHDTKEKLTLCVGCNDMKVWRCRDCGDNHIKAKPLIVNSDPLCSKCQNKRCIAYYSSPSRSIGRPTLAKLHLDEGKTYIRNNSKTPVAIELECISTHDLEEHSDGDFYVGGYPEGWRDAHDGSLSDNGREFMMNPEIGDNALDQISKMCDWLVEDDWFADSSCGVHVHTDAFYMGVKELKSVLLTVRALEPFIYEMIPNSRRESRYSAPMSTKIYTQDILKVNTIGEFCNLWYEKMNDVRTTTDKYNDSRYRGFNLHSRILHGTLEYRYHQGSLNKENIINWVLFCLRISDFGSTLLDQSEEIQNLFIHSQSKNFSDYISAMGADSLKPYLKDCVESYGMVPERVFVEDNDWIPYMQAENR